MHWRLQLSMFPFRMCLLNECQLNVPLRTCEDGDCFITWDTQTKWLHHPTQTNGKPYVGALKSLSSWEHLSRRETWCYITTSDSKDVNEWWCLLALTNRTTGPLWPFHPTVSGNRQIISKSIEEADFYLAPERHKGLAGNGLYLHNAELCWTFSYCQVSDIWGRGRKDSREDRGWWWGRGGGGGGKEGRKGIRWDKNGRLGKISRAEGKPKKESGKKIEVIKDKNIKKYEKLMD